MNGKTVLEAFGFNVDEEPVSIYPFSPVYHVHTTDGEYIVKRTQSLLKHGKQVMDYTKMLGANGIRVVTPVRMQTDNPQMIAGKTYVVYPFIQGAKYSGQPAQIYKAGKLLGNIHALSPSQNYDLDPYKEFDFDTDEVTESVDRIETHAAANQMTIAGTRLRQKLLDAVAGQEKLQTSGLPYVATPYDYKANNLIFTPKPFLIDPDNASWVPRIFDLALTLLLFHNEMETAPDRMFTTVEWKTFLDGYQSVVSLTELERTHWQYALEHIFLDEVMWLMTEAEDDWKNPSQQALFVSLLNFLQEPSAYPI
ncbi:phosphotransferase [Virgibacillus sp. 179-BFC.A HS]|uniref:Phosphotransferase n=1 Tax=Tigheibacillus jepli TaxID=3035914 RepID=A0ABU5CL37_9BACI|nr:phosphotransferase [Virgibacillus sp. 179-BFC.A HS]MDY0407040.1 phosphotransferase [Virgibacillus sp. 179-BFC.A HS]